MKSNNSKPTVAILATLDTKGTEVAFLKECLRQTGVQVRIIDGGIMGRATVQAHIPAGVLARKAGSSLTALRGLGHEGQAMTIMIRGAARVVQDLYKQGELDGLIGIGGSMGTSLGTGAMRALPFGVPKLMVSTMASRDTRPYVGSKDILMFHSVVDLVGLNRMTRQVLSQAAGAIAGMVQAKRKKPTATKERPLIAVGTLGTTEGCLRHFRGSLEEAGWEIAVFHTVGSGGLALEELVLEGTPQAIIEISLKEIVDHIFKGSYDAGPTRLEAGLKKGLPTIIIPGNIDFISTGPPETLPNRYKKRPIHVHNPAICVVRTNGQEMKRLAKVVAEKISLARGPLAVLLPTKGFSAFDSPGKPFFDLKTDQVFIDTLKNLLPQNIPVREVPAHINEPLFGQEVFNSFKEILT